MPGNRCKYKNSLLRYKNRPCRERKHRSGGEKQKGSRGIRRGQGYRLVFQFPIRQAVHVHPMPFSHLTFGGLLPLYRYFSARCAMRALNTLYQPVPHVHGVSCCRSDAERQSRPEVVARTGFHELVRGLARYLTGGHFRLLPDGFWCQNRRESDPAHYLRRYRDVFLSTGGTFQRPDITAIQRGGRPVNKAVCIK